MSVINQMLKELDQRQNSKQGSPDMDLPVSHYEHTKKKSSAVLIGVSVVVLMIISVMLYKFVFANTLHQPSKLIDNIVVAEVDELTNIPGERAAVVVDKKVADEKIIEQPVLEEKPLEEKQVEAKPIEENNTAHETVEKKLPTRVIKTTAVLDLNAQSEQQLNIARKQATAGNVNGAEKTLVALLEANPNFHKARVLMFSLSLQKKQLTSLEPALASALSQWPNVHEYRQVQARLLLLQSEQQKALEVLQSEVPSIQVAPEYHALLAYIAQQTKNDSLAIGSYQSLLSAHPNRADWWLGLAVSEERQGNKDAALKAYQQSVGRPGLSTSVQSYARQRIKVLQGY